MFIWHLRVKQGIWFRLWPVLAAPLWPFFVKWQRPPFIPRPVNSLLPLPLSAQSGVFLWSATWCCQSRGRYFCYHLCVFACMHVTATFSPFMVPAALWDVVFKRRGVGWGGGVCREQLSRFLWWNTATQWTDVRMQHTVNTVNEG